MAFLLKIIFIFIIIVSPVPVSAQVNWNPNNNGVENTYMDWTWQWKKEIAAFSREVIMDVQSSIYQVDQMNWQSADDLRYQIGLTIGRIMELHRQQVDMYRRMKRRLENRFNWLRPELSAKIPELPQVDGAIEPVPGQPPTGDFGYPWNQNKPNMNDYKPQTYITALEFITRRETEIEHLVKANIPIHTEALVSLATIKPSIAVRLAPLLHEKAGYTAIERSISLASTVLLTHGEEEVARFRPELLPANQYGPGIWWNYATTKLLTWYTDGRRQVSEAMKKEKEEEDFKAKMRANYYKRRGNNKK